jgi:tyrocidine synthetase-3
MTDLGYGDSKKARPESEVRGAVGVVSSARNSTDSTCTSNDWQHESNLTTAQRLIWLGLQLNPDVPIYNMIHASTIHGPVNLDRFENAFQKLVDESDAFRTTVKVVNGGPQQHVAPQATVKLEYVDLAEADDSEKLYRDWLAEKKCEVLNPQQCLYSTALVKLADDRFVWYLCLSHLVADAQSFALAYRYVASVYELADRDKAEELSPLPLFSDYVEFEKKFCESDGWKQCNNYWRSLVENDAGTVDFYGVTGQHGDGKIQRLPVKVGAERSSKIRRIATTREFNALSTEMSLSCIWTTLISVLLHRISGGSSQRLAMPFQARPTAQFKETIGSFVEVGAVTADFDDLTTFQSLHGQMLRRTINALRFARPGISSAEINRSCPVRLNYVTAEFDNFAGFAVKTDWIHSGYGDTNQALQVQVCDFDRTGEFTLYLDIAESVFVGERKNWLTDQLNAVIDAFIEDPLRSIGSFDLLSDDDRNKLLLDFNATAREYEHSGTILAPFQNIVAASPDKIAITDSKQKLTYRELDLRSTAVSSYLQSIEVGKGQRVAICMRRSLESIIAMLGVLKSGAAFCPFDHAFPMKRKSELLDDLQPSAVFVSDESSLDPSISRTHRVYDLADIIARGSGIGAPVASVQGDDIAYLIYTSGSTGKPKAAMLSHDGLANYISWAVDTYTADKALDFPLYSSLAFDLTLTSIFAPLVAGGKVRVYPECPDSPGLEVLSVFADDLVDVVKLTPAHLELLRQHGVKCQRIRKLIVGGEELKTHTAKALLDAISGLEIYNEYGPTEATVGCMVHRYDPQTDKGSAVPIGTPAANMGIYVRDHYDQPVPRGVVGEMVVAGPGVAFEYWNRPRLTAQKFGIDERSGRRQYRTGDLARWQAWGIEFLGRADDQVKIRGARVELGELEAHLLEHPQVESAAVILKQGFANTSPQGEGAVNDRGDPLLVAYYVSDGKLSPGSLKNFLESRLPSYMLPQHLAPLDEMPLTQNGKIDRKALPNPAFSRGDLDTRYLAASTPLQHQLVSIWQDVLDVDQIGIDDNFFELGGDSVMCIQVCARAQERGLDVIPRMLFQNPSIRLLADHLPSTTVTPVVPTAPPSISISVSEDDLARVQSMLGGAENSQLDDLYPLTPTQSGMLFHCVSSIHRGMYIGQVAGSIEGDVDLTALYTAYAELVAAHPVLRTRFFWHGLDEPLQGVCPPGPPKWDVLDWSTKSTDAFETDFELLTKKIRDDDFDLAGDPPLCMTIVIESDHNVRLIWTTHHILFDGWSAYPLFDEWLSRYGVLKGAKRGIQAPVPFKNYVAWLGHQDASKSRAFWRKQLEGVDEPTILPLGNESGASSDNRIIHEVCLDRKTTEALEQLARRKRVTLNAVFQSAWAILLQRYCGRSDIIFGATHSGRNADVPGIERMVGLFINTLPVRLCLDRDMTFEAWLPDVHEKLLSIGEFEHSSLAEIQRHSGLSVDNTLFDSIVVFENYPTRIPTQIAGIQLGPLSFTAPSHYPLAVLVYPDDNLTVHFVFDDARFSEKDMSMLGDHLTTLLEAIAVDASRSIETLPILSPAETQLLHTWSNAEQVPLPTHSLTELIDAIAAQQPDDPAIVCGDETISYGDLEKRSDGIARVLRARGVCSGSKVAVVAHRTPETVVGILAVMKAGGAFVPLDIKYPASRINDTLDRAGIGLVLTDRPQRVDDDAIEVMQITDLEPVAPADNSKLQPPAADDLAYVLFTSGSTGRPKGVMVSQRNIVSSTIARQHFYEKPVDAFLHLSSFAFDSAMAGLFWTLCDGGLLVLPAEDCEHDVGHLTDLVSIHSISHLLTLPNFYDALLEAGNRQQMQSLRTVIVAGEACFPELHKRHRWKCPTADLVNEYGPTEATVWSHAFQFPDEFNDSRVPIGKAIANVRQFVLDSALRPVPVGVPGELVLGGTNIAQGYLGAADVTSDKFIRLPASLDAGDDRYYRTGDAVAWRWDGSLDFLGRIDEQLKIRGHRVEPGEIESVFSTYPDIEAIVVGVSDGGSLPSVRGRPRLTAWFVATKHLDTSDLRTHAESALPEFMRPDQYIQIEQIPTLPNGKTDRRRLAREYGGPASLERTFVAPESENQKLLSAACCEVLDVERAGLTDNFLELGGDSISALRVAARLHRAGKRLAIRHLVSSATLADLSELVADASDQDQGSEVWQVPRASIRNRFPLSSAQTRMWFLDQMEGASRANNVYNISRISGELNPQRLKKALQRLAARHEILRTVFVSDNEDIYQQVLTEPNLDWTVDSIAEDEDISERLEQLLGHEFEPSERPPWVARLTEYRGDRILVLVFHHMLIDGESMPVLLDDISRYYAADEDDTESDQGVLQYGDYANWQVASSAAGEFSQSLAYWKDELAGELPTLDFPGFRARPKRQSFAGEVVSAEIPAEMTQTIRRFAEAQGVSLFNVLLATYAAVLMRYCRQSDVVIGTPAGGIRHRVDAERSIGPYINTLPIRLQPDPDLNFDQLLEYVSDKSATAIEMSDAPFEDVVASLDLPRDLGRTPVFQTIFAFRRDANEQCKIQGAEVETLSAVQRVARTDIACWVVDENDRIRIDIEFPVALANQDVVSRFLNHFIRCVSGVAAGYSGSWSSIALGNQQEVAAQLRRRGSLEATKLSQSICDLVWSTVDEHPERVAITFGDLRISYSELRRRSMSMAGGLAAQGVSPGDIVGLATRRSELTPVTILGILQCGAAYVPLDLSLPKERLDHIVGNSGLRSIITDSQAALTLGGMRSDIHVLDEGDLYAAKEAPKHSGTRVQPELAYIMYTSGSTGVPKGVEVRHRQVVNFLTGMQELLDLTPDDVLAAITTTSFDISILELLLPLCSGACVNVVSDDIITDGEKLRDEVERCAATVMQGTPASWRMLVDAGWICSDGFRALCGGERLPLELARTLSQACSQVWNLYGPTETTVWSTAGPVAKDPSSVNIGFPIQNTRVYVIDEHMQLVPDGVTGQLAIAGEGLAAGYHDQPELTRKAFLDDPYFPGERMYLTGDLGRWRPDATLEHLGRIDGQLKLRGFRIEAGDVENNLATAHGVAEVAVAKRTGPDHDERLVAFLIAEPGSEPDIAELRDHLATRLPHYMIPQHYVFLAALPLTPNRKVDYRKLPQLAEFMPADRSLVAASNADESAVIEVWEELLGTDKISMDDNFFALGGHSLLIARLARRFSAMSGLDVPISDLYDNPTPQGHARLLGSAASATKNEIEVAVDRSCFPMSSVQRRLWFLEQFENAAGANNIFTAYRIRGNLDVTRLRQAFEDVAARHEILRTTFDSIEGNPCQKVLPESAIDWQEFSVDEPTILERQLEEIARHRFDLSEKPPWFVRLVRFNDEHFLLSSFHHVLIDAESLALLLTEVSTRYRSSGADNLLPESVIQYGDFANWQMRGIERDAFKESTGFWLNELSGDLPALNFPSFVPRPIEQTFTGGSQSLTISETLTGQLRQLAKGHGSSLFNVLLAAFGSLLLRFCRQHEVLIGMPVGTARHDAGAEECIGPCVNTVAVRLSPTNTWTVAELLDYVGRKTARCIGNAQIPFEDVVRMLPLPRDLSRTPVFQAMFSHRNASEEALNLTGASIELQEAPVSTARTDIACWVAEKPNEIRIELEYATELFDRRIVAEFLQSFERTLELFTTSLNQRWSAIPLWDDFYRRSELFDGIVSDSNQATSIVELFMNAASEFPDSLAVSTPAESLSYEELRDRSKKLAINLQACGVSRRDIVGLAVRRTERLPLAMLGILQAGAAYLPLDPEWPADRRRHVLENSEVQCIVTDIADSDILHGFGGRLIPLDDVDSDADSDSELSDPTFVPQPDDLAYLMYTSGSTGLPKGVEIRHSQVVNLLQSFRRLVSFSQQDVLAAVTTTSFDISVLEIFLPLCSGGTTHIIPEEMTTNGKLLADETERCGATVMQATPATWRLLLDAGWRGKGDLRALCGGEALSVNLAQDLTGKCHTLWNVYGPTETTVWSSIATVDKMPESIHIGKPIDHTQIYILDENLRPVPIGTEGEIVISGKGLAKGYRRLADLTEEKFVPSPINPDERIYRTGDLGRFRLDGNIEHLGRLDRQLKIRGYRIEAGDVEHHILSHEYVTEVAVVKRTGGQGDDRLVAFVVTTDGAQFDPMSLRRHARERLPQYMVPQHFVSLEHLPLTPNRKIDYANLPELDDAGIGSRNSEPPKTATERMVAEVWAKFLGVNEISRTDNFMEMGGHSLLTIRVIAELAERTDIELGPQDLFSRTLQDIAAQLEENSQRSTPPVSDNQVIENPGILRKIREFIRRW